MTAEYLYRILDELGIEEVPDYDGDLFLRTFVRQTSDDPKFYHNDLRRWAYPQLKDKEEAQAFQIRSDAVAHVLIPIMLHYMPGLVWDFYSRTCGCGLTDIDYLWNQKAYLYSQVPDCPELPWAIHQIEGICHVKIDDPLAEKQWWDDFYMSELHNKALRESANAYAKMLFSHLPSCSVNDVE